MGTDLAGKKDLDRTRRPEGALTQSPQQRRGKPLASPADRPPALMPPRARAWLAREVPSQPGAAMAGLLFLAGVVVSLAGGSILPAALFGAGAAYILIAYLATYGATWPPRQGEERPG